MQFFLQPIIEMLLELESSSSINFQVYFTVITIPLLGIEVHPCSMSFPFQMKVYTICACFDLLTRASALNMMQFNG